LKAALFLIVTLFFMMNDAAASVVETPRFTTPPLADDDAEFLNEILSSEDFGTEKPGWEIRLKKDVKFDPGGIDFTWRDLQFPWLREVLGLTVRAVLAGTVFFLLIFGARYMYKRRGSFFAEKSGVHAYSARGRADDPGELLARAGALHREGEIREAWALCFRAFIAVLGRSRGIVFPAEATEYEALALAGEEGGGAFSDFIAQWIAFAYAGKIPGEGTFEAALASCRLLLEMPCSLRGTS
jgi:hypothetical protein